MKIGEGLNTLLRHKESFSFIKNSLKHGFSLNKITHTNIRTIRFFLENYQKIF